MPPEDESQPTDSNLPEETIVDPVAVVTNANNSDTSESATKTEISESKIQESSLDVMQDSTTVQPILESSVQQVTDAQPSISPVATPEEPINIDDANVSPFKDPSFKTRFASFFKMVRLKGNAARAQNKQKKMDEIVELAAKHGAIGEKQIRLALRVSAAEASICLHELVVQGRLRHVGPMHAGKYEKI